MPYTDGTYTNATLAAPQTVEYPFLNQTGDSTAKIIRREYVQATANYAPSLVFANYPTLPAESPFAADNTAYLVGETQPLPMSNAELVRFERTFATVPNGQTTYTTVSLTKPDPVSALPAVSLAYYTQPNAPFFTSSTITEFCHASDNTFYYSSSDVFYHNKKQITVLPWAASGGTFSVTFNNSATVTLNHDVSNASFLSQLQSNFVGANISVATSGVADNSITAVFIQSSNASISYSNFTYDFSNLSVSSNTNTIYCYKSHSSGAYIDIMSKYYVMNDAAHNVSTNSVNVFGDISNKTFFYLAPNTITTVNSNYYLAPINDGTRPVLSFFEFASNSYTQGADVVRSKKIQKFYLPSVTPNISSIDDVPVPDPAINDRVLMDLIMSGNSQYQTYTSESLAPWIGPIYTQTEIQIKPTDLS